MKYLKLFVTLVVLTTFVATLGLAGMGNKAMDKVTSAKNPQVQQAEAYHFGLSKTKPQRLSHIVKAPRDYAVGSDILGASEFTSARSSKRLDRATLGFAQPKPRVDVSASTPLAGTYQIPGDFSTIGNAIAVLNYVGISDDVVFELTTTSYNELSSTIGSYAGNANYSVTIQPAAGVAATVNFISSNSDGKGFAFNGAKNFFIDGLNSGGSSLKLQFSSSGTFPTADAFGATIYITGASEALGFYNLTINGQANNATWSMQTDGRPAAFLFAADSDPYESFDITFDHCYFNNATYGLKVLTEGANVSVGLLTVSNSNFGSAPGNPLVVGSLIEIAYMVTVEDNMFDGVNHLYTYWLPSGAAVTTKSYTEYDDDAIFAVGGRGPSFLHGIGQITNIHALYVDGINFRRNVIKNITTDAPLGNTLIGYGCRVAYFGSLGLALEADVQNNVIDIAYPTLTNIAGIRGDARRVYHNSIRISGAVATVGTTSTCMNQGTFIYNNAFSNEQTGGTASLIRGVTNSGTIDYNAINSTGYYVATFATANAAITSGWNANGLFGSPNFGTGLAITAGPSSAEDIGKSRVPVLSDILGNPRDTTAAGVRDAGAYEFASTGSPFGPDLIVSGFVTPPAGVPFGVPQAPVVRVKNNSNFAVGSFDVHVTSTDGYDQTVNVAGLTKQGSTDVTFPNWNPAAPGAVVLTASASIMGDISAINDSATKTVTVTSPTAITGERIWNWNTSDDGWTRSIDWVRKNSFSKLGGPYDGFSMVTERPNLVSTYTEGAYANTQGYATTYPGANLLTSDWYDLSGNSGTDLYISFFQSIKTESIWDRAWLEYTTDGLTWHIIGTCNDPNGTNWYDDGVYPAACIPLVDHDNFDLATAIGYGLTNIQVSPAVWPGWTSDADETTPSGWIYNAIKLTSGDYPTRASAIKFRYVAFADAVYGPAGGGWAIDNFRIGTTPTSLDGGFIAGKLYHDLNGNGAYDMGTDSALAGQTIIVSASTALDTLTTDSNGDYSFNIAANGNLPAIYSLAVGITGYALSEPAQASTTVSVGHSSNGGTVTQNIGAYMGSVTGTVFSDLNNNHGKDVGEPGLQGWSVEIRKSTVSGTLVATVTTNASGVFTTNLPPFGTYFARIIKQNSIGRLTNNAPDSSLSFAISGNSGSGTAAVTDKDFGVFIYGKLEFAATVDFDGSGTLNFAGEYNTAVGAGHFVNFKLYKNGTKIDSATIGNGVKSKIYSGLDLGTYVFERMGAPAGWYVTAGTANDTVVVDQSGISDTLYKLHFKYVSYSGTKFNDLDGDGIKDVGEPGLAGWTINVSGNGGGSTTTDASGNFSFTTLGPDSHYVTETPQAGWTQTKPASNYAFKSQSASLPGQDKTGLDFGNFQNYSISGTVYRDYNNDGGEDEGMDGVTVTLTGASNATTSGGGNYTFTNVGPGAKTLAVTAPSGYTASAPVGGSHAVTGASGTNLSAKNFSLFQTSDGTTEYRTFTLDSLQAHSALKSVKKKAGTYPNLVNALEDLFKQAKDSSLATGIIVGEAGNKLNPLNAKSADKGYIKPDKASAVQATLYKKGKTGPLYQNGTARGLDFLVGNEKRITKLNKSLGPDKHSNVLVGNLMTLGVNIAFSDFGKTPAGLADLVYIGSNADYQGMTVADIYATANDMVTNWEFVESSKFTDLNAVIASINAEFAGAMDTAHWLTGKLSFTGVKSASESSLLRAPGGNAPARVKGHEEYQDAPTTFVLGQNYPNPFNPTTNIRFSLPSEGVVTVKVYNMLGQEVATVLDNESYFDGEYEVSFDAKSLTSGVYFYRVNVDITDSETGAVQHISQTKKMLLTK